MVGVVVESGALLMETVLALGVRGRWLRVS